ncbi:T9SS type A sorting domain-containing protein [Flavobacterium saccharophilum]|uniref:Por secretion system C-terminal sorting domain-containing protein n=1 Tax=Flavobacterium saccharophilum TaxID=29534 RepID=A0A1M7AJ40_9FLAO|nr:T9SS type A sorting domain-containing protein [Flavobacterium saccharophilum]SHL42803.1 Por secretion system C-terminal sorting domain-containing protein [Flavobacterium saccharophilum]
MKKTLLCFLFLFTTTFFYAQINDIVHCPGDNNFDLAKQKPLLIGNLNPDETTVSFHLSLADATNNTNAIATPSNYNAAVGVTTIYVRIDNNGTITTNSFNIKVVSALNITATNTPVFCSGEKVSLTVTPSGGVGPYYYSLNGGSFSSNATFNNLSAGVYNIQVLDTGTSCPTTFIYTIAASPLLNATAMISGQMVTITPIGGTTPYQYSLEGINYQLSPNFANLTPGNHVFMVRDINGCIATVSATVLPSLTTTAIITKEMDCSPNSNASITIAAAGGQSPYTYSLNDGPFQANNDFNNLFPGTYSIKAKDAVNTISNPTAITINPLVVLSTTALVTNPTSCSTGTITAMATGGKAPYVYSFDGGINFISSNIFSTPNPGTYVIIVKDSKGCLSSSFTTTVQPAQALTITASNKPILCNGETASLTINVSGGSGSYQYTLNEASFVNDSYLPAGIYNIEVRDIATGCIATTNYTITEPTAVTATYMVQNQNIAVITASGGTGPYQYSLDGISYQASNVFTNLIPGTYDIRVRDAQGCSTTLRAIIAPFLHAAVAITKELDCTGNGNNGAINVAAIGGQAPYLYSVDSGYTYQGLNIFNNLSAGTYSVTVKDALNSVTNPTLITLDPPVPVNGVALVTAATSCTSASMMVHATSGQSPFYYSIDNGQTFTNSNIFSNLSPGNYTFFIKDSKGCVSPPLFNMVQQSPPQLLATASSTPLVCAKDKTTVTINATGGQTPYQYALNNGTFTGSNTFNIPHGTHYITVKDAVGCMVSVEHMVVQPTPIYPDIDIDGQTITINGQAGTAPYQYSVDSAPYQTENVFTNLSAGSHSINLKDAKGCESYGFSVTISDKDPLIATAAITKQVDCISNAEITITATGGQLPYQYSLDGGVNFQDNPVFTNLPAGTYTAFVADALYSAGNSNTIKIEAPATVTATVAISKAVACGESDTVTITAAGGKAPYLYSFDESNTYSSVNISNSLQQGSHTVFVKDSNGCSTILSVLIESSDVLSVSLTTKNPYCFHDTSGKIIATATGGKAPYAYSIGNDYVGSNTFDNLSAGQYTVSVKDALGCISTAIVSIVDPTILSATASSTNSTTSTNSDGTITATATGGAAPYLYAITDSNGLPMNFQNSFVFTGLKAGSYDIHVKDSLGCTTFQPNIIIVNKPTPIVVNVDITAVTCVNPVGIIKVNATGGILPYKYSFNGASYVPSNIFTVAPGSYIITVSDADNNQRSIVADIIPVSAPSVTAAVTSNVLCKGDNTGSIKAAAIGGKAPYSYSLDGVSFNTTDTFTNLRAGTYTITVKDVNSCFSTTTITLTEPIEALSATAFPVNDQSIVVTAKGGTAPYKYFLQDKGGVVVAGPQDNGVFARLPLGLYGAQITDANGCGYIVGGINIIPSPPLSATADVVATNCINPGTITVQATGGFQPYYYSFDDGATFTISNVYSSFIPGNYAIKVRDYKNTIVSLTASLTQGNLPVINATVTNVTCKGSASGSITATVSGGYAPYTFSLNNEPFITTIGNNIIFSNLQAGVHRITMKDANGCLTENQVVISEPTSKLTTVTTVKNQTITVNASGGAGNYNYAISPNLDKFSTNNVFSDLTPGFYNVIAMDANGCFVMMNVLVDPPAPLIDGKDKMTLEFKPGQTLADLIIDGENIKWYSSQNPLAGKNNKANDTPLPLTTVLVDGTTYYASQTINGVESKERLAVTAKLNGALSTPNFVLPNFTFYPNPVLHSLTISNTAVIDEVEIFSVAGKSILAKKINSEHSEIDLSNIASGFYFLKVNSEGQTKTIKIVKK